MTINNYLIAYIKYIVEDLIFQKVKIKKDTTVSFLLNRK